MMTSILIATLIYITYNVISIIYFGIPNSLSQTYYLWKSKANIGYVFTASMAAVVLAMMPAWITISEGSSFQFLSFLAPAAIMFVAMAPAFMSSDLENKVHSISAICAAVFALAWVVLVAGMWWIILVWLALVVAAAIWSKTIPAYVYWLETIAFGSTFTSVIIYAIWK